MPSRARKGYQTPAALLGVAAAVVALAGTANGQSFQLLGLPAGTAGAAFNAISYDGSIAAGASFYGPQSFPLYYGPGWTWTPGGGQQTVGGTEPPSNTNLYGMSGDGRYVVGEAGASSPHTAPAIAYRYDRTTGQTVSLGVEPGGDRSRALAANESGAVVVGYSALNQTLSNTLAFRWTEAGGLQSLGFARPGDFYSSALAVSADGETVIGESGEGTTVAFRWTSTTGMMILDGATGTNANRASGMSSSGEFIVGLSGNHAALWTNGVYSDIGTAPGYVRCIATGISDNGLVAIGLVTNGPPSTQTAAIWLAGTGWQPLEPYLLSIGVTVPDDVNLNNATAISRDGRTIVGYTSVLTDGTQRPWVVTVPSPASLVVFLILPLLRRSRQSAVIA